MLGNYSQGMSNNVKNVLVQLEMQLVEPIKVCRSVNHKSGDDWAHFGVDIPFFDGDGVG